MTLAHLPTAEPEPDTGPGERRYTTSEVMALTGASFRNIDYWLRCGHLPDKAPGSGYRRSFTEREIEIIHAVVGLLAAGFTVQAAFPIAEALVDDGMFEAGFGSIYRLAVAVDRPSDDTP